MPRTKPVPTEDIQIGKRLMDWRKRMEFSRVALARLVGLDSSQIARIELGRTALSYRLAYLLCKKLHLHPAWLRYGDGNMFGFALIPDPASLNLPLGEGDEPFRLVFDDKLAGKWIGKPEWGDEIGSITVDANLEGRSFALRWLEEMAKEWIAKIPDEYLNAFVNAVLTCGHDTLASFPQDTCAKIEQRRNELIERLAILAQRRKLLSAHNEFGSKLLVDIPKNQSTMETVNYEIPTWKQILSDLKRLTKSRGEKAALAAELKTTRQNVNKWLAGEGMPSAELTLSVLRWVRKRKA